MAVIVFSVSGGGDKTAMKRTGGHLKRRPMDLIVPDAADVPLIV
jgi:hypothetical protein